MMETSSSSSRPVVVRVKRKASQSPLEAFWLEINERPQKQRVLLDLGKLSLSDTPQKEELKNKKVFLHHLQTLTTSDDTIHVLHSFVPADSSQVRTKTRFLKDANKQDQLLSRSKEKHEFLAKNARFEQIWKSRKGKKETMNEDLHEICHLYDVVRVDSEEDYSSKKEEPGDTSLEDSLILSGYLPLLKEFLPTAAKEIESDMQSYFSTQGFADDYVYDLYTVQDEPKTNLQDLADAYPLVQVNEEDDFYEGPTESEYESDDSNAEDNPLNDYPEEEETSEEEDEDEEEDENEDDSEEEEEEEESIGSDNESGQLDEKHYDLEDEELFYEEEDSADDDYDEDREDDWR